MVLYPEVERAGYDATGGDQFTYELRVLTADLPHGPACPDLACADARARMGHRPLDPAPELTAIAARILERAAALDEERIRLAPGAQVPIAPTLTVSAGVGALLGVVAALWVFV